MQGWADECALIRIAALNHGLQWEFIAAIRKAENGGEGREFGVLSIPGCDTYEKQLDVACNSVVNRLAEFDEEEVTLRLYTSPQGHKRLVYSADFIQAFGNRWAPCGAENDPHALNRNWVFNVTAAYYRLLNQSQGEMG